MTTTHTRNRLDPDSMLRSGADSVAAMLGAVPAITPGAVAGFSPTTTMAVVTEGATVVFGISIDANSAQGPDGPGASDSGPGDPAHAAGDTIATRFFAGIAELVGQEPTEVEPEPFESVWRITIDETTIEVGVVSIPIEVAPTSPPPPVSRLSGVRLDVSVELGRARIPVKDLLALDEGGVIRLGRAVGEPVDLVVNGTVTARGEIVVVDGRLGLRITTLV